MKGNSAADPPVAPQADPEAVEEIELVPYGDTSLRISQFPVADIQKKG